MSLATDTNTGGVIDGIRDRFAAKDEARMRELDAQIAAGSERDRKLCLCGCLAPLGKCAAKVPPCFAPEHASRATDPAEPQRRELAPAMPAPTAPVHAAPPPATPAEEETMPKGKRPCGCAPTGRHKSNCPEAGKSTEKIGIARGVAALQAERAGKSTPAPAKVERLAKPRRQCKSDGDLEVMQLEELAAEREHALEFVQAIDAEVARRREQLEEMFPKRATGTEG